jgi:signal transduction histidine kinase
MIGATEMLRDPDLPAARRAGLCDVQRQSAGVLMDLVNDVLDAAKLDAGKVILERRPLNLAALVRDVEAFFAPEPACAGSSSPRPRRPTCRADRRRRHAHPPGRQQPGRERDQVHARRRRAHPPRPRRRGAGRTSARGGMRVRIQVADSGVGIDPARCRSCSSRSTRPTRASRAVSAARGLGLSIANELAG